LYPKTFGMKKFIVAFVLVVMLGIIAYASMSRSSNKKDAVEKKTEKKEKKECARKCLFS